MSKGKSYRNRLRKARRAMWEAVARKYTDRMRKGEKLEIVLRLDTKGRHIAPPRIKLANAMSLLNTNISWYRSRPSHLHRSS